MDRKQASAAHRPLCRLLARSVLVAATMVSLPAIAGPVMSGGPSRAEVATACSAPDGENPRIAAIEISAMPAAAKDLPFVAIRNRADGASARIYHDPALRAVAESRAACFGGLLFLLAPLIPDARHNVEWASIVLTRDRGYIPPRAGSERRWIVPNFGGRWDADAIRFLVTVMPHEEVHHSQASRRLKKLPRWFQEGHAEWVGLKVTEMVRPDLARDRRDGLSAELAAEPAVQLGSWGGVKIKDEAIERQLSLADRERRAREPGYMPPGPFNFGAGDFAEDNVNQEQRYAAALALFEGLERRHGPAAVAAWVSAALDADKSDAIIATATDILGEDIAPLLR